MSIFGSPQVLIRITEFSGTRGSVVGWGIMLQAGRSTQRPTAQIKKKNYATSRKIAVSSPDDVDFFFSLTNPSGCTMALGSTHPLTEMSTKRRGVGGKGRPAGMADNLTATCEQTV
jgi:hypothetical protein